MSGSGREHDLITDLRLDRQILRVEVGERNGSHSSFPSSEINKPADGQSESPVLRRGEN